MRLPLVSVDEIATSGGVTIAAEQRLAARFAANEAVLKLLRPTESVPSWRCIEFRTADNGAFTVQLSKEAATLAAGVRYRRDRAQHDVRSRRCCSVRCRHSH
jgi:phosphopantetheinyl transferase (holo-ACP synthase)